MAAILNLNINLASMLLYLCFTTYMMIPLDSLCLNTYQQTLHFCFSVNYSQRCGNSYIFLFLNGGHLGLYAFSELNNAFIGFFMFENIQKDSSFVFLCQLFRKMCQFPDISSWMAAILDYMHFMNQIMVLLDSLCLKTYKMTPHLCISVNYSQRCDNLQIFHRGWRPSWIFAIYGLLGKNPAWHDI